MCQEVGEKSNGSESLDTGSSPRRLIRSKVVLQRLCTCALLSLQPSNATNNIARDLRCYEGEESPAGLRSAKVTAERYTCR